MRIYKLIMIYAIGMLGGACSEELATKVNLDVTVTTDEQVQFDGETVTVKKGTPVKFVLQGNPDFISFFSGEDGAKYIYKDRTIIDPSDIVSSQLTFTVKAQYGHPDLTEGVLKMYVSDEFPGLYKNNYEADSVLVEQFNWSDLVTQTDLPQKPNASYSADLDLTDHLGKPMTLAIYYKQKKITPTAGAPRMNFTDMKIVNTMKSGQVTTLYAGSFGFTPINMMHKWNLPDQASMTKNREYGTSTSNVSGIWNLVNAGIGAFQIHSSSGGTIETTPLKYSWLVSNHLTVNACTPDRGTKIKDSTLTLEAYTYIYEKPGTYNATFLARNLNFEHSSEEVINITIKVTD